jgi:hypothetical protein
MVETTNLLPNGSGCGRFASFGAFVFVCPLLSYLAEMYGLFNRILVMGFFARSSWCGSVQVDGGT